MGGNLNERQETGGNRMGISNLEIGKKHCNAFESCCTFVREKERKTERKSCVFVCVCVPIRMKLTCAFTV